MKPVSAVLREREGAFIMATNMTNSEAMVTSAAPYTTESKQKYPQGMGEARQALESILHLSSAFEISSTKTTSFPVAALDSIYRCASTISSNLNTRSRRTVLVPCSTPVTYSCKALTAVDISSVSL